MSVTGCLIKAIKVAACFLVMLLFIGGSLLASLEPDWTGAKIVGLVNFVCAIIAGLALLHVIQSPSQSFLNGPSLADLEQAGMVTSAEYKASRAIMVEEFEDEGLFYLLDIGGGRTLCMTGQDLYDYEPLDEKEDGEFRARRFPCTHFEVKFHSKDGYILDIVCHGQAFDPQYSFEHFTRQDCEQGRNPENGDIVTSPTFEELIANKGRLPQSLSHA